MENTITAIKTLQETLRQRNAELEELILSLEEQTCSMNDETETAQDLIHQTAALYKELRLNDKLMNNLSLCEYCKLSDKPLCKLC